MKFKKFVFTSAAALTLFSTGAALAEAQAPTSTVQAATTKKKVMHNAYYYKKDGKTIVKSSNGKKKMVKSYHFVKVSKKVTINGSRFYKISGKQEYIKASAIDGTKRTLTHNAHVYTSKGKRKAGSRTLKKGKTVTTYGAAFTIKKNGVKKSMYRIASGEYVIVGNFKKSTAKADNKPNTSTSTNTDNTSDALMKKYQSWIDNANNGALVALRDTKEYNDDGTTSSIAKGDFYQLPDPNDDDEQASYAEVIKENGKYYIEVTGPEGSSDLLADDFTFSTLFNTYLNSAEYKNLENKYVYDDDYIGAKVNLSRPVKSVDGKITYHVGDTIEIEDPEIIFDSYGNYSIYAYVEKDEVSVNIPISSIASYDLIPEEDE